jgi:hypothetical protein
MGIRNAIYLFGIALLIIGLPFSRALISMAEVLLIANWLFSKDLLKNLKTFFRNRQALWFSMIYVMHLIGILYTSDMDHGFQEIRTKAPILLFPLIFVTSKQISKTHMRYLLMLFASAVTASLGTSVFLFYTQDLVQFRDAFPFISHIRLSLMVVIALSIMYYYLVIEPIPIKGVQAALIFFMIFNTAALFLLELLSGMVILTILVFVTLIYHSLFKKKNLIVSLVTSLLFVGGISWIFIDSYNSYFPDTLPTKEELPKKTAHGNHYYHEINPYNFENNSYTSIYICFEELQEDWNKRSEFDFNGKDLLDQHLKYTLIRYLNSKGLTKDRDGLAQLDDQDISYVEQGIANYEYTKKWSIRKRLYKVFWEYNIYQQGQDVAGHSVIQRIELWQVAHTIFKENWLIGIGTGDIRSSFKEHLEEQNSSLQHTHLRTHNQFFSILLAFGVIGFILFIFSLTYPAIMLKGYSNYLFLSFFVILTLSMLWEDTLETHVGAMLFSFFYAFYLFAPSTRNRSLRR